MSLVKSGIVSWIQSEISAITLLWMLMMVQALDTWCNNGQALDAELQCLRWLWRWRRCTVRICRCRRSVSVKWAGFHVLGPWIWGFLGMSFIAVDWLVRVFGSSGILGRPSECLYIRTIPIYGCMDRWSHYRHQIFSCCQGMWWDLSSWTQWIIWVCLSLTISSCTGREVF